MNHKINMRLENSDLLYNFLVLQISKSNTNFIELLLNHGYISYSQLCYDILKLILEFDYSRVERGRFHFDFNCFITYYLQFVKCENKKFKSIAKQDVKNFHFRDLFAAMCKEFSQKTCKSVCNSVLAEVKEPDFMSYVDRLKEFINLNSLDIDFDHLRVVKNSKLFDVCTGVKSTSSENALILSRNKNIKNKRIFAVDDFHSFLSPLKEDYTKSSQGYNCQNKILVDENQLPASTEFSPEDFILTLSDDDYKSDESSYADDENFDLVFDNIISKCLDSLKKFSSDSDIIERISNSDSDDSITFSDHFGKCMIGYGTTKINNNNNSWFCDIQSSESDSEDCEIFDNRLGNKFFKVSSSNINDLGDFDVSEASESDSLENCDKNSSLHFKETNSLSQSNFHTYSAYFDTDKDGFTNPCFEDDDDLTFKNEFLRDVNDEWKRKMQDVSCEPREPKKVCFLPMPNLVTIKTFESEDDGYHFGLYLLDQVRFKNRIEEFEQIIKPYLSVSHRANIYEIFFRNN